MKKTLKILASALPWLGSFFLFCLTLFALVYFYERNPVEDKTAEKKEILYTKIKEEPLGNSPEKVFGLRPNSVYEGMAKLGDKVIYKVTYDLDSRGMRKLPMVDKASEHIIFAGCSFTYGQGLPVSETFPFQFNKNNPRYQAHNWSAPGGGIHAVLYHQMLFPLDTYVKKKKGKMVYTYIHNHLSRWFARPDYLNWAFEEYPHFEVNDGKVVFKGLLKDLEFYQNFKALPQKTLLKLLSSVKGQNDWSDKELKDYSIAVKHLKDIYLSQFPEGEFIWFLHPTHGSPPPVALKLKKFASESGIKILDPHEEYHQFLQKNKLTPNDLVIPVDIHPNGKMNSFISQYLENHL